MDPGELVTLFRQVREDQLALCDTLEAIADSLPGTVDRQVCIQTARALRPIMNRAHKLEEETLFPAIAGIGLVALDPKIVLERLRIEHAGDAFFAEELAEVLWSYGEGKPSRDADTTGYMLRGFFESLRRHLASERDLLDPAVKALAEIEDDGTDEGPD